MLSDELHSFFIRSPEIIVLEYMMMCKNTNINYLKFLNPLIENVRELSNHLFLRAFLILPPFSALYLGSKGQSCPESTPIMYEC